MKHNHEQYDFKFSIDQKTVFERPYGSIVLLEKTQGELT